MSTDLICGHCGCITLINIVTQPEKHLESAGQAGHLPQKNPA